MKLVDIPVKFQIPWGSAAGPSYIRAIPKNSQIGIQDGAASLTDGFPPLTFIPRGSGGVPPFGADANGILNQTTSWARWQNAGATVSFDATFSAAVGGYPTGAVLRSTLNPALFYVSTADDNTTNPDAVGSADWQVLNRIRLAAPTTFYVRSDGSDANTGLVNNAGGAFLTLQRASDVLSNLYDFDGYQASITIGMNATYAGAIFYPCVGQRSPILVTGFSTAGTIFNTSLTVIDGANVQFSTLKCAGGANGIVSSGSASCTTGIEFGTVIGATSAHLYTNGGGSISMLNSYTISGGAGSHYQNFGAETSIASNVTITLTGTPAFVGAFLNFNNMGFVSFNQTTGPITFTGAATGSRYSGGNLSCVNTGGMSTSYLPGSAAGTLVGGAVYN